MARWLSVFPALSEGPSLYLNTGVRSVMLAPLDPLTSQGNWIHMYVSKIDTHTNTYFKNNVKIQIKKDLTGRVCVCLCGWALDHVYMHTHTHTYTYTYTHVHTHIPHA